jgi:hypothetical protein
MIQVGPDAGPNYQVTLQYESAQGDLNVLEAVGNGATTKYTGHSPGFRFDGQWHTFVLTVDFGSARSLSLSIDGPNVLNTTLRPDATTGQVEIYGCSPKMMGPVGAWAWNVDDVILDVE